MEFLANIASGGAGGIIGSLVGAIGGIASAFVKLKTLKESNRHYFVMAELAGNQEVSRATAALKMVEVEGAIKTDLAIEESMQASFAHDSSLGAWLKGKDLGWFATAVLSTAEFIRMMMRPVLTLASVWYVFHIYGDYMDLDAAKDMTAETLQIQIETIVSTIILLATVSFTWWFADRSVSKALTKKLVT